jgi:RNA polymerase sigma-70 factor (ECF subfamily)
MNALATQTVEKTIQEINFLTIVQRIGKKDKTAVKDCIDNYGNFIWASAKKITASTEEAEAATQEIFTDIWRYSERTGKTQSAEEKLVAIIALRQLIKHIQ